MNLLSLCKRLLCRLKVLSLKIFIILIPSRTLLVLNFKKVFSWFVLLKLGCVLYTRVSYMPSNMVVLNALRATVSNMFILILISSRSNWPIDRIPTGTATLGQSGPGNRVFKMYFERRDKTALEPEGRLQLFSKPRENFHKGFISCGEKWLDNNMLYTKPRQTNEFLPK